MGAKSGDVKTIAHIKDSSSGSRYIVVRQAGSERNTFMSLLRRTCVGAVQKHRSSWAKTKTKTKHVSSGNGIEVDQTECRHYLVAGTGETSSGRKIIVGRPKSLQYRGDRGMAQSINKAKKHRPRVGEA